MRAMDQLKLPPFIALHFAKIWMRRPGPAVALESIDGRRKMINADPVGNLKRRLVAFGNLHSLGHPARSQNMPKNQCGWQSDKPGKFIIATIDGTVHPGGQVLRDLPQGPSACPDIAARRQLVNIGQDLIEIPKIKLATPGRVHYNRQAYTQ